MDPEARYGSHLNPALRPFGEVSRLPCLALLGEPGIGKTETMKAEREAIDAAVAAEGGKTLWLDLRSCGSEQRLVDKLFGSPEFASWLEGDHQLHVFLDSLDECLLRIENVAALLVDELQDCSVERLSLRIGCRTAEWPAFLEEGLKELWPEGEFEAYELAPLRRADVVAAAIANGLDPESFLRAVDEAAAVPLAIKPVTLDFLMGSYRVTGEFPTRQADLYLEGCRWLCEERSDSRVASRRTGSLTPDQRLAVAARIAAVTVFSNKYAVWTGVQSAALDEEDVLIRALAGGTESVGEDEFPIREETLREALGTGLFSARGSDRLGWAHQTYAEFLAARYLVQRAATTEQAMSLLVHPEDEEGRLVPQLHEAAAWLAGMSPEVFRKLTDADPEVLLRSDVASTDVEDKVALVETLLRLYNEEQLLDAGWAPRDRYERLEHSGLAEQLSPYVVDGGKSLSARRVALDIAEACGLRALQDDAARVALDPDDDLLVRKEAAHFVAVVGDDPTRACLLPLALGTAGDDPEDDLKGNALRALWPDHVGAEELFGMLTLPKNPNYMGAYESFLTYDLTDRLRIGDLPVALAWVEDRDPDRGEHFQWGELADQIMQRAWTELPNPGVAPAFARAALARLKRHEEVVKEQREVFEVTGEPAFSERIAADDRRRRLLLEEMIGLLESEPEDALYLVSWKTTLVATDDVEWLVERLTTESSERRKAAIAALIGQTYRLWDDEAEELVYLAHCEDETLAREVGRIFAPVELGSEDAEEQRRLHERLSRWEKEDEEPPPPDPPVSVLLGEALDKFEVGDVEAFWASVYELMQYDERGCGSVSGAEWDMTGLPGWEAADDGTRTRIVEAAKRYVLEGDPRTDEWFGKDITYKPAFAGYRALCLLLGFAPEFLEMLPADVWEKWVPSILDFPVTLNTEEEKDPHLRLVATAYDRAPDRLISTLLTLVDQEDAKGHVFVTRSLERCWDDRLAHAVLEKAKDPKLKARTLGVLLGDLLGQGLREARDYAEDLVSSSPRGDESQLERAAVVAGVLFFFTEDCGWGVLWPAMQEEDEFADAVVNEVCSGVRRSDLPFKHLTERQVADFYLWMAERYPRSEYFIDWGHGMIAYGCKENISEWRDGAIEHLRDRGTFEACQQIERVMAELPELQETLKWTLYAARTQARRRTWLPPEPEEALALAAHPGMRLVQNGDQLLEVLVESLGRLEGKLQGETPMAPALWNQSGGSYRPKDEDWFSDFVKQHLQEDLRGRGLVLNREVVIRKGEGEGRGERTDIHVNAVVPGSDHEVPDLVTVIVEAKGCWNAELDTAMQEQLVDRYLADNPPCRHGLYLIGWFNCQQWDETDWRKRRAPKYSLGQTRQRFAEQAKALSERGPHIRAIVVNAALR